MLLKTGNLKKNNVVVKPRTLTVWDLVVVFIAVMGAFAFIPVMQTSMPLIVAVYVDNDIYATYPISENREFTVKGKEGLMEIHILDNSVYVNSSTCRKQICVKTGAISRPYQQLICAPNHVLIEIKSKNHKDHLDALTR